jgi:hypothetical protein
MKQKMILQVSADQSGMNPAILASWKAVFLSLLPLALLGCAAAYNVRTDLSPDERHAVSCYVRGAFGRDYYSETRKRIIVTIYSRGPNDSKLLKDDMERQAETGVNVTHEIPGLEIKQVFEKKYWITGSSVNWRSVWRPDRGVSVVLYDFGRNKESPYGAMKTAPERALCTLDFAFDPATSGYVEVKSPEE